MNYLDGVEHRQPVALSRALRFRQHGDVTGRPWGRWDAHEAITRDAILHTYDQYGRYLRALDKQQNVEFLSNNPEFGDYLGQIRKWQKTYSKSL